MPPIPFTEWLRGQIKTSGLSIRSLSRRVGISHPTISRVLAGKQVVTHGFCIAIARGIGLNEFDVLYRAGLLPESERPATTFTEPGMTDLVSIALELSPEQRQDAVTLLRALRERRLSLYVAGPEEGKQTSSAEGSQVVE